MNRHMLWMIIGCTIPLLLIVLAPSLGISESTSTFVFIIAMFACHLFMMKGHHHSDNDKIKKHNRHKGGKRK